MRIIKNKQELEEILERTPQIRHIGYGEISREDLNLYIDYEDIPYVFVYDEERNTLTVIPFQKGGYAMDTEITKLIPEICPQCGKYYIYVFQMERLINEGDFFYIYRQCNEYPKIFTLAWNNLETSLCKVCYKANDIRLKEIDTILDFIRRTPDIREISFDKMVQILSTLRDEACHLSKNNYYCDSDSECLNCKYEAILY